MPFHFASPAALLWVVISLLLLFVVAPHLAVVSKQAARTLRLGAGAALVQQALPFALFFARQEPDVAWFAVPLLTAAFWGSFALAAWQLVQGTPKKEGLL